MTLREIVAAALALLVGLPPSAGFVAAGVNRVIGLLMHAPITTALMLKRQSDEGAGEGPSPPLPTRLQSSAQQPGISLQLGKTINDRSDSGEAPRPLRTMQPPETTDLIADS